MTAAGISLHLLKSSFSSVRSMVDARAPLHCCEIYVCVCVCVCMFVRMYVCMYVYVCVCVCVYIYIYIYIHTQ